MFFFASKLTLIDQIPQELKVNSSSHKIVFVINQEAHCYNHVEMLSLYGGGLMRGEGEKQQQKPDIVPLLGGYQKHEQTPVVIRATQKIKELILIYNCTSRPN
jgi:hypothetical protein